MLIPFTLALLLPTTYGLGTITNTSFFESPSHTNATIFEDDGSHKKAISKIKSIKQVKLTLSTIPTTTDISIDEISIRRDIKSWLLESDIEFIESNTIVTDNTYDLAVQIITDHTSGGIYKYAVIMQCSNKSDTQTRQSFHISGQKDLTMYRENLSSTIRLSLSDIFGELPKNSSEVRFRKTGITTIYKPYERFLNTMTIDFEQLKIKNQPPPPAYPKSAIEKGIQGIVVIGVVVDTTGTPILAEAESGPKELLEAAINYALTWEFEPALLNGKPKEVRFKLTMPFRLK